MMRGLRRGVFVTLLLLGTAGLVLAGGAAESTEDYPSRPITVLIGFNPGGGSDAAAQMTQPYLQRYLNANFTNEYRPGASGAIAWTEAAGMRADGYLLTVSIHPMKQANYILNETIAYTVDDFTPIANVYYDPHVLVVGANSAFETAEDLFEYVRANPGEVSAGHPGIGSDGFFAILMTENASDMSFSLIPFEGDGPSWQAAMGGHIDVSFNNVGITFPQVEAGNLRPLAVFSEERTEMLPDVPTMRELGIDVVSGSGRGYSAPAGLPEEIRDTLIGAFQEMAADPQFRNDARERALEINMIYGDDYYAFLKQGEQEMLELWAEVRHLYEE